jgi:HD-like signal output (HDOD) protein
VWKSACISHAGQVEVESKTSVKTLHDAILFAANHQHTWKKYRTETRKSNAIEIIIKQVLPFLGKP